MRTRLVLAPTLVRWLDASPRAGAAERALEVEATTLREALDAAFVVHPTLRGYVLDEHGTVRHHVAVFVGGTAIADKSRLDVPLPTGAEIYIMQALSGG